MAATDNLKSSTRAPGSHRPALAAHSANWLRDMGVMIVLAVIFSLLTWIRLRRLGPRRRKA